MIDGIIAKKYIYTCCDMQPSVVIVIPNNEGTGVFD